MEYPPYFSEDLKDLLEQLLQKDPEQRLCKIVAAHALFLHLDWSVLRNDPDPDTIEGSQEAPPFQPGNSLNVEDPDEIGTFRAGAVDPGMFPARPGCTCRKRSTRRKCVAIAVPGQSTPKKSSSFCSVIASAYPLSPCALVTLIAARTIRMLQGGRSAAWTRSPASSYSAFPRTHPTPAAQCAAHPNGFNRGRAAANCHHRPGAVVPAETSGFLRRVPLDRQAGVAFRRVGALPGLRGHVEV